MKKIFFFILFLQLSLFCYSQADGLTHYSNAEVNKLTNYIKELEKRNSLANPSESTSEENELLVELLNEPSHAYSDLFIIKLFKYIKELEKKDSQNKILFASAEAKKKDDTAMLIKAEPIPEYHLAEEKEIDNYERVIFFNRRSDTIKLESFKPLDSVVSILIKYPGLSFEIEGHTDSVGSLDYNQDLSQKRAMNVMNYFISKGIPSTRISAIGYGETKPVDTNETAEGKARNRRVEIKARKK